LQLWVLVIAGVSGSAGQLIDAVSGMGFGVISSSSIIAAGGATTVAVTAVNLAKIGGGLISGAAHWRLGNVRTYWFFPLAVAGVIGGVTGALLHTEASASLSKQVAPWLLIGMAVLILRRYLFPPPPRQKTVSGGAISEAQPRRTGLSGAWRKLRQRTRLGLTVIGFTSGVVNAWTGSYGPVATSSVLVLQTGHPRYVVGTINAAEFFVAIAVSITLITSSPLDAEGWTLAGVLFAGSLITAPIGAMLSRRVQPRYLGIFVAVVMIGVNAYTLVNNYTA
jgi:hypothetical protein